MITLEEYKRYHFMQALEKMEGTLYSWGGDDSSGFDCSGMVVELLKVTGFLHKGADLSANGLWKKYHHNYETENPKKGAICFYFKNGVAIHVVVCLDQFFAMGANGGNRNVVDRDTAIQHNAFIKRRPIDYRPEDRKYIFMFKD